MSKAKKPLQAPKSGGHTSCVFGWLGRAAEKLADTVRHVIDVGFGPDRIRRKMIAEGRKVAALDAEN